MRAAYSYYELAAIVPQSLLLASNRGAASEGMELLLDATARISIPETPPLSRWLPFAGDRPQLSPEDCDAIRRILNANEDALFIARMAAVHNDFRVVAIPALGVSRVAKEFTHAVLRMMSLEKLLCLSARVVIAERRLEAAVEPILHLYRLSQRLCVGGGDMDFYFAGSLGQYFALSAIQELIANGVHQNGLSAFMGSVHPKMILEGYIPATISDFLRDVVLQLAQSGDDIRAALTNLIILLRTEGERYESKSHETAGRTKLTEAEQQRFEAILIALRENPAPFDARETLSRLTAAYEPFCKQFPSSMGTRLSDSEAKLERSPWPEEFQCTSHYPVPLPSSLVAETAPQVARLPNALGLLLARDIVRRIDELIRRSLIFAWRPALLTQVVRLNVAIADFRARFGVRPLFVEQLYETGICTERLFDPLTNLPLVFTGTQIIGPRRQEVRKFMILDDDAPECRWEIEPPTSDGTTA